MDLHREQIERQFDRAAGTYDEVAPLQREMGDFLLEQIPAIFTGKLVDLGCGTGDLLAKVANKTRAKLTGIDLSAAMLAQASVKNRLADLVKADLTSLPFADASFDMAVSNAAIQWCDARQAFAEMARILRPGGRALISTFGPDTLKEWRDALAAGSDQQQRIHNFPNLEQLNADLQTCRFGDLVVEKTIRHVDFSSVTDMLNSIRKLGATNARQGRPAGLSGRAWLDRLREQLELGRSADGKLKLTYECYFLFANKR